MAKAQLIFKAKKIYSDGAIKEMVIWRLPNPSPERPHGLKYRLYYGTANGCCMIRYDNETGKGDHRHIWEKEEPYPFKNIEQLINDFQQDIDDIRSENNEHNRST